MKPDAVKKAAGEILQEFLNKWEILKKSLLLRITSVGVLFVPRES